MLIAWFLSYAAPLSSFSVYRIQTHPKELCYGDELGLLTPSPSFSAIHGKSFAHQEKSH
jgi:hypothetical protein